MYIIGVDGGGTKCKASLFTLQGQVLASAMAGSANLYSNFEMAIESIEQVTHELINKANDNLENKAHYISPQQCLLSLGCAGASITSVKLRFAKWQHNYCHAMLTTDIHVSCLAAQQNQSCALVIVGTGSCVAIYDKRSTNSHMRYFGGHGFLLGDIGSGAWLGKHAVSWYLQAVETSTGEKPLFNSLKSMLGTNTTDIVEAYGKASALTFGKLVPTILAAQSSSALVESWLHEGARYFANLLSRHADSDLPIYIDGGLAQIYAPRLQAILNKPILSPLADAVHGAYLAAIEHKQSTS